MKKSIIVWLHVGFCCMYVLLFLSSAVLFAKHLTVIEMGQGNALYNVAIPFIFYIAYFLTYLFLKNKKNIVYVVLFYLIVFFYPEFAKYLFGSFFTFIYSTEILTKPHTIGLNFYILLT